MANAWESSAFSWVGLAFIVERPAMGFRASTALKETAPSPGARRIIGALSGIRELRISKERNQFLSSTETTPQPNSKTRRCAIAIWSIVVSFIIGGKTLLQRTARGPGKRNHHV